MNKYQITRSFSILLGISAYLCVPVYYAIGLFEPPEGDGHICGLYILGPLLVAGLSVFLFSSAGTALGAYSYKKGPNQKSWKRSLELLVILLPALIAVVITASIFIA